MVPIINYSKNESFLLTHRVIFYFVYIHLFILITIVRYVINI